MLRTALSACASISIATLLFAASFKIRFGASEAVVLYAPVLVLGACTLVANALDRRHLGRRVRTASLFMLIVAVALYTFFLGGLQQSEMFGRILINCTIGFLIAVYPWNRRSLSMLLLAFVAYACVLALNTLAIYDSLGSRRGYDEEIREGYLNVTFAAAIGSICALYRLIERLGVVNVAAFALTWVGTALSLGRGALLFGAFVSLLYLLFALSTRLSTMGRPKKLMIVALFLVTGSVAFYQAMSVERTAQRMAVLFGDAEGTAGVGGRFEVYGAALDTYFESPIFGNGMGAYLGDSVSSVGYPHNVVLQYLVDAGLIGGAVITFFLAANFYLLWTSLRRSGPDTRNLVLASGALYLFMVLSYMKSHDAYRGLELFLLSAIPMATYAAQARLAPHRGRSRRRVRRRSRGLDLHRAGVG